MKVNKTSALQFYLPEYIQYAQNLCKHWDHMILQSDENRINLFWQLLSIFPSLSSTFFLENPISFKCSLDKDAPGSFLLHAALYLIETVLSFLHVY